MRSLLRKDDVLASVGVFVVALPLSLGIALASGVSAQSAIISAIIGGIIVGALSGAPLAVTGPAAGLSVIVFEIVREQGLQGLALATVVCGLIQVIFGSFKFGQVFKRVPHSILDGMLAAIGAIIALGQIFVMLSLSIPNGFFASLASLPSAFGLALDFSHGHTLNFVGLMIGLATIVVQLTWERLSARIPQIPKALPGALVALTVVSICAIPFDTPRVALDMGVEAFVSAFGIPGVSGDGALNNALFAGVILAVVGSVESLATASGLAIYAEKSRGVALKIQLNKELIAQGVGNLTAGFFGGIPVTAVIVRSAANVQFGASSRVSTMLHGLWILLSVIVFGSVLRFIPLSALAAILVVTGVRLVNIRVFLSHARHGTSHAMAYMVTFSAILATNLLRGLICGMVFAGGSWILQRYQVRTAS